MVPSTESFLPRPSLVLILCMFLSGLHMARSDYEHSCDYYHPVVPNGVCGKKLSDLLSRVCVFYNSRKKRSIEEPSMSHLKTPNWVSSPSVFMPKDQAMSVFSKRGVYGQGRITCECCYYTCSIRELGQYCSSTPDIYTKRSGSIDTNSHLTKSQHVLAEKQAIGKEILQRGPAWLEHYHQYTALHHHQNVHQDPEADRQQHGNDFGRFDDGSDLMGHIQDNQGH